MNVSDPIRRVSVVSTGQVQIRPAHVAANWQPTFWWLLASRRWTGPARSTPLDAIPADDSTQWIRVRGANAANPALGLVCSARGVEWARLLFQRLGRSVQIREVCSFICV